MTVTEEKKIEIASWLLNPDRTKYPERKLFELEAEIKKSGLEKVYREIELPLVSVLREMEELGIKIDRRHLKKLSGELGAEIRKLEQAIYKKSGTRFNINSPRQLGEVLFTR